MPVFDGRNSHSLRMRLHARVQAAISVVSGARGCSPGARSAVAHAPKERAQTTGGGRLVQRRCGAAAWRGGGHAAAAAAAQKPKGRAPPGSGLSCGT